MSIFQAVFKYSFMQNALYAGILVSILCAVIGTIIIEKKLVMLSGGVAHTAYGGVGFGYLLGFEPILGGLLFAIIASVSIGFIKKKSDKISDVLIALFWSCGMALGIIFINFSSGYAPDMSTYLFGNILMVSNLELIILLSVIVVVIALFIVFYNYIVAYLFDEEFLKVKKINVKLIEVIILVLIAVSVVLLIKITGIILVLALLAVPSATSMLISKRFLHRIIIAMGFGILYCLVGITISYYVNIPTGASIVLIAAISYFLVRLVKFILGKIPKKMKPINF